MPFRERARNLFKTKSRSDSLSKQSSSSDSNTLNRNSTNKTNNTSNSNRDRYPSNVYRPDEPMPRPKYRLPPKKEHKEKLEAFNFADAWRKRSFQSTYSPMGTRAPSRRNSFLETLGGVGRKSRASSMRTNSVASDSGVGLPVSAEHKVGGGGGGGMEGGSGGATAGMARPRESHHHHHQGFLHPAGAAAVPGKGMETQREVDGDDDVANVGLSRVQSRDKSYRPSPSATAGNATAQARRPNINGVVPPGVTAHDHQPFSEHELQLAMQRSHLTVSAQS